MWLSVGVAALAMAGYAVFSGLIKFNITYDDDDEFGEEKSGELEDVPDGHFNDDYENGED